MFFMCEKKKLYIYIYIYIYLFIIWIEPYARSDWSKTHVLSEYKTYVEKACFIVFRHITSIS